jgi:hypothetical protein
MKPILCTLFAFAAAFAADKTPTIEPAAQVELLSYQWDLTQAQLAAAPYIAAVHAAEEAMRAPLARVSAACNPTGGDKYAPVVREHRVVCEAKPEPPKAEPAKK